MCFLKKVILLAMFIQLSHCDDLIELFCKSDDDCASYKDKMTLSICKNSNCRCLSINTQTPVNCTPKRVIINNKIGNCPCHVPNSHCVIDVNKCACDSDFIETPDSMRCIKAVSQLSDPCEMNEQCVKFDNHAVCSEGVCKCLSNFTMYENSCRSLVKIGEHCESSEECRKFTTNATCLKHHCACDKGFIGSTNGNICLPNAKHLESCKQNSQCENGLGPGSVCDNGKCVCDQIHRNFTDKDHVICQRKVLHGDECKEHSDCLFYLGEPTMYCFQYRCKCRDDYELYDAYKKECVKKANSGAAHSPGVLSLIVVFVLVALVNQFRAI